MKFLVINGVNLARTGEREKSIYGEETLDEINAEVQRFAAERGHAVEFFQSDIEGEICQRINTAAEFDGIVLNAGAYSHYSIAIRDAVAGSSVPVVEVHMSNVHARETFRRESVLTPVCRGEVLGFGKNSYKLALESFWL